MRKSFLFLISWVLIKPATAIIGSPVKCFGSVPKITEGKYYYHDNNTKLLRVTTNVNLLLDLYQRSCFQVDIENTEDKEENSTESRLTSLFYSVRYLDYEQSYSIRSSYQFGVAELQSDCKCDCPSGDNFCTSEFDRKPCSKGEVCVTRFHSYESSTGCSNSGAATLCCEIFTKPYQNRKFTAISLAHPTPHTKIEIEIYALYEGKWSLFRRYRRSILPFRANYLRLNGFDNVAEMYVRANTESPMFNLKNGDKWYFYENSGKFKLYDDRRVNGMFERDAGKFGWLRWEKDQSWSVGNAAINLHDLHRPLVTNCKEQEYLDGYNIQSANVIVIRNSSGAINKEPYLGAEVSDKQNFVGKVQLSRANYGDTKHSSLTVSFKEFAAPVLQLELKLHQKMSIVAHTHASYLENYFSTICIDKHGNRYLNITLIKSYGKFNIEVYRDREKSDMDLVLSILTELPFASNYSEIFPLPNFISSSRLVCVNAETKPNNRLCKWASFETEPVLWFELTNTFVNTAGRCPGCNKEVMGGAFDGFLNFLNPKNWFNGINSVSEGFALIIDIVLYVVVLVVLIALARKCFFPLMKWSFSSSKNHKYLIRGDDV